MSDQVRERQTIGRVAVIVCDLCGGEMDPHKVEFGGLVANERRAPRPKWKRIWNPRVGERGEPAFLDFHRECIERVIVDAVAARGEGGAE